MIALSRLENVRLLKLASFRLADKPASHHEAVLEMVKVLKNLEEFHIVAVDFRRSDHVFEILQSLPPNCSITLNEIEWDEDALIVPRNVPGKCHLLFRSFQMASSWMINQFATYILAKNIHPTVDTFKFFLITSLPFQSSCWHLVKRLE